MSSLRHLLLLTVIAMGVSAGAAAAQGASGTVFSSAAEGVDKVVAAARAKDIPALDKILGPDSRDVLRSGDDQADNNALDRFVAAYDVRHKLSEIPGVRHSAWAPTIGPCRSRW